MIKASERSVSTVRVAETLTRLSVVIALLLAAGTARASVDFASYHIGNSLTWDSQPQLMAGFAEQLAYEHAGGWHIKSNSSLTTIRQNPNAVDITPPEPYGLYTSALPNFAWDAVTLQVFSDSDVTIEDEIDSVLAMIDLARSNSANADTRYYIYPGWPGRSKLVSHWDRDADVSVQDAFVRRRPYAEFVLEQVRAATDAEVYLVPVGEVFYEVGLAIERGEIPGYTDDTQLYRDPVHADWGEGRYLASVTTFATLYGADIRGLTHPGRDDLDPAFLDAFNRIAYDVVQQNPYTGVPEPSTLALCLGGSVLFLNRRRKS